MVFDDDINSLSDFEERVFVRLLVIADDYGIIPGKISELCKRTGIDRSRIEEFSGAVRKLLEISILQKLTFGGEPFFSFKPHTFDEIQTEVRKRTRSEYLKVRAKNREELESQLDIVSKEEILLEDSGSFQKIQEIPEGLEKAVHLKYKVTSIKDKVVSRGMQGGKNFNPPTLEEVILELQNREHPNPKEEGQKFHSYYEAVDWIVGKKKMVKWKAALSGWLLRSKDFSANGKPNGQHKPTTSEQHAGGF